MLSRLSNALRAPSARMGSRLQAALFSSDPKAVLLDKQSNGVAVLQLNRPEKHNAMNEAVISEIAAAVKDVQNSPDMRVLVFKAAGKSFCAGADLEFFQKSRSQSKEDIMASSVALSSMLNELNTLRIPTIAAVQGPAYGGGVGLVSCCDIAVGVQGATTFTLSEVKIGMIPATISPYVVAAIGARNSRRYFVTAELFDAQKAQELGLLHHVVADQAALEAWVDKRVAQLLNNGPNAVAESKRLVTDVANRPIDAALIQDTAERLLAVRTHPESAEGIDAFMSKRKASWCK